MIQSCKRHDAKSPGGLAAQRPLDHIMTNLHENQGGEGRHKCPYCAYERGWNDAVKAITDSLADASNRF